MKKYIISIIVLLFFVGNLYSQRQRIFSQKNTDYFMTEIMDYDYTKIPDEDMVIVRNGKRMYMNRALLLENYDTQILVWEYITMDRRKMYYPVSEKTINRIEESKYSKLLKEIEALENKN